MTSCWICGNESRTPLFSKDGYDYTCCDGCGWACLDPLPGEQESSALYSESYFYRDLAYGGRQGATGGYVDYAGDQAVHGKNAGARCRLLPDLPANASGCLLDVGCAVGFFLEAARRLGWRVSGVEPSPWASAEARRRTGSVIHDSLLAAREAEEGRHHAVTFFQVLEHLPRPAGALAHAHACLRPGGLLVIETWDRESLVARLFGSHWQQVTPPSVIHLFTRRDLDAVLDQAGFRLRSIRRTSKRVSAGFVAGLLADKYPAAGGRLRRAIAGSGLGRIAIHYRLGDLITLVAERRD